MNTSTSTSRALRIVLLALALGSGATAFAGPTTFAGPEMLDLDARFRAKLAKEKIRTAAQERQNDTEERSPDEKPMDASRCGSQSIGNIDSGGRAGAAPREEFVFAPNSINIVGRGACR